MLQVDLETLELDNPDIYPSTLEEIKAETEVEPNLSVLCAFVALQQQVPKMHQKYKTYWVPIQTFT